MAFQCRDVASGTILDIDFHTASCAISHDGGLGKGEKFGTVYVGGTAVYLLDDGGDVVFVLLPFVPIFQLDDEHTAAGCLSSQHAVARHVGVTLYLWDVLDAGFHFRHSLNGLRQTAARRRGHVDENGTHVFIGHQSGFGVFHQHRKQGDGSDDSRAYQPLASEEPFHTALITQHEAVERGFECLMEPG